MVRLEEGSCCCCCCWQLRRKGEGGSLSALSNYVWRFHAGPLSKIPQHSHANTQTHIQADTHPSLMIQSCDCRLPVMIELLHSSSQHKSMSITSPEHIRHFPFLLVISMAHRHIPIPLQAHSGVSVHTQQSWRMKWIHHIHSNTWQCNKSYAWNPSNSPAHLPITFTHIAGCLISAGLAITQCVNGCENEQKQRHMLLDLGLCAMHILAFGMVKVYACIIKWMAVTLRSFF